MVIVSDDYLISIFKDNTHPLLKTHLSLDKRGIVGIAQLHQFRKLEVIDLRDNFIFSIVNLANQSFLTNLYLQNNEIRRLDGFNFLVSLRVLFLDYNKVEIVENLHQCPLQILSVRGQILPPMQTIAFEPICMKALAPHLEVIDVSKNRLLSIRPLCHLAMLEDLDASGNEFNDLDDFLVLLTAFQNLKKLNLIGTPIASDSSHVKEVVNACKRLTCLNGQKISIQMRTCCEKMTRNRRKSKHNVSSLQECYDASVSSLPTSFRPVLTNNFASEVYDRL